MENIILKAKFLPNGPILLEGMVQLKLSNGEVVTKENPVLCRCGHSKHKPFCDGQHSKEGWKE